MKKKCNTCKHCMISKGADAVYTGCFYLGSPDEMSMEELLNAIRNPVCHYEKGKPKYHVSYDD